MYFDFGNYFRMLRLALREQNPRNRRRLLVTLTLQVPLLASFHAVCFWLDPLLFPSLRRTNVRAPIFVVGHARSGTTLLHRLMCRDEGRFSAFRLYELFFPSLLQKKAIRGLAVLDARLLGGRLERRVRAWEERKFGKTRGIHEQSLTEPEEDDGVLTASCASGAWIVRLPYMGELDFYHVDRFPQRRRRRLMGFYRECVRRQLHLNGSDRIHLSKNPIFAGRIESLIEAFPDARFVVPLRNPYETVPSLLKLMKVAWSMRRWSEPEMQRSLRILADQSIHTYRYPLQVLESRPQVRWALVDYRDLVSRPAGCVEGVYRDLGLPMTVEYRRLLEAEERAARSRGSSHRYSLEEFGLRQEDLRTPLRQLFERFGWDEPSPETAEA